MDSINRFLVLDRLDTLQAARRQRDPLRIARAKDAVRKLMEQANLPAELFEMAVLALIDPSSAYAPGAQHHGTIPYYRRDNADADRASFVDVTSN